MRAIIDSLTLRGRALVITGTVVVGLAWLLGQSAVLPAGVLAVCLPLIAALTVVRTRFRLTCARGLTATRIALGASSDAVVRIGNSSRFPTGTLLVSDSVPELLGGGERLVAERLAPGERREVRTALSGTARGRYTVGPVSVTMRDPFGLCEVRRSFNSTDTLIVAPRVCDLPSNGIAGLWGGRGDSEARSIAHTGDDDVIPRAYRIGDELRRVHWRATARSGELMVRREEQPWRTTATVLLDRRESSHVGRFPDTSLEVSIAATASIALHLARLGLGVRILDTAGVLLATAEPDTQAEAVILDALALLDPTPAAALVNSPGLRRAIHDGTLVAVVSRLEARDARVLAELRGSGGAAAAVVIDSGAWSADDAESGRAGATCLALADHGWRTARVVADRLSRDPDQCWTVTAQRLVDGWRSLASIPVGAVR